MNINRKMSRLHITDKHTGKMEGMQSISTSCKTNPYCAEHAKVKGSVCEKCYAQRQMKMYKQMSPCYERNAEILTKSILEDDELPVINAAYFRFESFGDLINVNQVVNYFNICKKNPDVHFALWTKNPMLIKPVADQKPDNLQIILSSLFLNEKADISKMPFIDKVFTVYDKETIEKDNIDINCGARSCLKCHKCYVKNDIININEKLK